MFVGFARFPINYFERRCNRGYLPFCRLDVLNQGTHGVPMNAVGDSPLLLGWRVRCLVTWARFEASRFSQFTESFSFPLAHHQKERNRRGYGPEKNYETHRIACANAFRKLDKFFRHVSILQEQGLTAVSASTFADWLGLNLGDVAGLGR
jgi:hypothetical protein